MSGAAIEITVIVFLLYANPLGEFARSGLGRKNGLRWVIGDVVSGAKFEIAMIAALTRYTFFEFLRKRF
jgi:hypothetical protein